MLVDRTHTHFLLILYVLFHEIYWLECRFYLHQVFITFSVCIRFFGLDKQTSFNWYQSKNPFIDWRFIFLPFSYFWIVLLDSKFPQDWNIILFSIGWDLVFMFFFYLINCYPLEFYAIKNFFLQTSFIHDKHQCEHYDEFFSSGWICD